MKAEIINVTPAMAADWLGMNTGNRPLRRSVVEGLKEAFRRGEYTPTHQGIAFSDSGVLLDGQHRLTAISELRDGSFQMLVTRGLPDAAFKAMDIGVKRTAADALQEEDKKVVETARLIAVICTGRGASVTPTMLIPIIENIRRHHNALLAFCSTNTKMWSSAPVRLAAILAIKTNVDVDYVRSVYRALVQRDFDALPTVAKSLVRAHMDGRVRASDVADTISRCLVVFRPEKANIAKLNVKDVNAVFSTVRLIFGHLIEVAEPEPAKKNAAPNGAAKSVLRADYRMARA